LPAISQPISTTSNEFVAPVLSPSATGTAAILTAPAAVPAAVASAAHQPSGADGSAGISATPELSAGLQMWNGGDNAQTRLVQSAHLSEGAGQSEMSVALQSDSLGAVEVHAKVTGDHLGATIAIERHDAHQMIASDVSSLHDALSDRQFRIDRLTLFEGSLHSGAGANDGGPASQQREANPQRLPLPDDSGPATTDSNDFAWNADATDQKVIFDSNGRLSVQA